MRRLTQWLVLRAILLVALLACAGAGWAAFEITRPGPLEQRKNILFSRGTSLRAIATQLKKEEIVASGRLFVWTARLTGKQHGLQAGDYTFAPRVSLSSVLGQMRRGETIRYSVTVPEGLTVRQIEQVLMQAPYVQGSLLQKSLGQDSLGKDSLGVLPQEGTLLPDTYAYRRGEDIEKIVERMRRAMERYVARAWRDRSVHPWARRFLKSERDVVIFASLVERETGKTAERGRIAGVFYNRLKRGMKLQTDPTLVYWESKKLGVLGRGLRRSELLNDHPYNTYVHKGLPPTPIANPGRLSIIATLHPVESNDLYFVADGKGGHRFAKTLAEHARNVALWRKVEAKRRRSKSSQSSQ